jgi:hypothetical protein
VGVLNQLIDIRGHVAAAALIQDQDEDTNEEDVIEAVDFTEAGEDTVIEVAEEPTKIEVSAAPATFVAPTLDPVVTSQLEMFAADVAAPKPVLAAVEVPPTAFLPEEVVSTPEIEEDYEW